MAVVALPRPDDLLTAPERAALALLDAALAIARAALLAENHEVVTLGDPEHRRDPPLTCVLAARLPARLHRLLRHDAKSTRLQAAIDACSSSGTDPVDNRYTMGIR